MQGSPYGQQGQQQQGAVGYAQIPGNQIIAVPPNSVVTFGANGQITVQYSPIGGQTQIVRIQLPNAFVTTMTPNLISSTGALQPVGLIQAFPSFPTSAGQQGFGQGPQGFGPPGQQPGFFPPGQQQPPPQQGFGQAPQSTPASSLFMRQTNQQRRGGKHRKCKKH